MRTNVVLDNDLVSEAQRLTGIKTKKAILDEALRTLIRIRRQARIRELEGKLQWEGNLAAMREGRVHPADS